jgi:hypothetical protein
MFHLWEPSALIQKLACARLHLVEISLYLRLGWYHYDVLWSSLHATQRQCVYAAEPDALIEELRKDEAITEADTLLLTVPNQLGVAYNAHVLEAILTTVAPTLGWR